MDAYLGLSFAVACTVLCITCHAGDTTSFASAVLGFVHVDGSEGRRAVPQGGPSGGGSDGSSSSLPAAPTNAVQGELGLLLPCPGNAGSGDACPGNAGSGDEDEGKVVLPFSCPESRILCFPNPSSEPPCPRIPVNSPDKARPDTFSHMEGERMFAGHDESPCAPSPPHKPAM